LNGSRILFVPVDRGEADALNCQPLLKVGGVAAADDNKLHVLLMRIQEEKEDPSSSIILDGLLAYEANIFLLLDVKACWPTLVATVLRTPIIQVFGKLIKKSVSGLLKQYFKS
jgi:hypothetical protein